MSSPKITVTTVPKCLSQEMAEGKGFVKKERLDLFSQMANLILATPEDKRSNEDKAFLSDFVQHVAEARVSDARLDNLVAQRAINKDRPLPATPSVSAINFPTGPSQTVKMSELALKAETFEGKSIDARP